MKRSDAQTNEPILVIDDVSKSYPVDGKRYDVLKHITLAISGGEFVAIMGPSGSGKSTLMHLMGCLDKPTAGKILFEGKDISSLNDAHLARIRNQSIGFVFQQFNLLARMPAYANVELPLIYARIPLRKRKEKALAALQRVGLQDKSQHHPSQLSGGQQQRVAIARAIVMTPSLLLADEPTGNLDSKSGSDILDIFCTLHEHGTTVVIVTHDSSIAHRAHRILHIVDGAIVSDTRTVH